MAGYLREIKTMRRLPTKDEAIAENVWLKKRRVDIAKEKTLFDKSYKYSCYECQSIYEKLHDLEKHQKRTGHKSMVEKQLNREGRTMMDLMSKQPTNQPVAAPDGKHYRCHKCKTNYTAPSSLSAHFRQNPDHRSEEQQHQHDLYLVRVKRVKAKAYRDARKDNGGTVVQGAPKRTSPRMKFCTSCGKPRKDEFKFCAFCGEKMVAV